MAEFRRKYAQSYQLPLHVGSDETFSLGEAKKLKTNLEKGIYESALEYLVGNEEDQRGLTMATLKKYNVGLGPEKFTDDSGTYKDFESIYFPLYMPKMSEGQSRMSNVKSMKKAKELRWLAEAE